MKSLVTIKFPESTSRNYKQAIRQAKRLASLTPARGKVGVNSVHITKQEFRRRYKQVETLWTVVRGWKGSELLLDGSQVEFGALRQLIMVAECGNQYASAVIPDDHCKLYGDKEGWGCKFLDIINRYLPSSPHYLDGRHRYWFQFGTFVSPTVWRIDKHAIMAALNREAKLKKLDLCPVFDLKKAAAAVGGLPDTIDVTDSDNWQIRHEQGTEGQTIEQKPVGIVPKKFEDDRMHLAFGVWGDEEQQQEEAPTRRFIPAVKFDDIGGIDDILQTVREVIELPLKHPELFQFLKVKPHKGILLHGAPGCGKTLIAKAIANEIKAHFIPVKGPELLNKYHGQSEENLRNVFEEAREFTPAVIFFDEIDSVAQRRSSDEIVRLDSRFVTQLLTLMDGIEDYGNVRVLASTNRPDLLDEALRRPGRFDYTLEVKKPTRRGCQKIFEIHTREMPITDPFDKAAFARQLEGLSGAQIAFVAREGAYNCLRRSVNLASLIAADSTAGINFSELRIGKIDFEKALRTLNESPTSARTPDDGACPHLGPTDAMRAYSSQRLP